MGKNIGDDLNEGKTTLPLIHVLQNGSSEDRNIVATAIRQKDASRIDDVLAAVRNTGSLEYSREIATEYQAQALRALDALPASPHRDSMHAIAVLAIQRDH